MTTTWHDYFIDMAKFVATKSKDRSTKVGAVIAGEGNEVLSTGFNGFPRCVDDDVDSRHDRPAKYSYTEHAERNAIYNAVRHGTALKGSTMYLNFLPIPCHDCARGVIQSGIARVIGPPISFTGKMDWSKSLGVAEEMLLESGVSLFVFADGKLVNYLDYKG